MLEIVSMSLQVACEASWAKACFSKSSLDAYVDEEWGSPWAAPLAQSKSKLLSFRDARRRLRLDLQHLKEMLFREGSKRL